MLEVLHKLLSAEATVTAVVSDRIHYHRKPQGETQPSIVLQEPDAQHPHHFDGPAGYSTGFVRINAFHASELGPKDLIAIIRAAFAELTSPISVADVGPASETVTLGFLELRNEGEIPVTNLEAGQTPPYHGRYVDAHYQHLH